MADQSTLSLFWDAFVSNWTLFMVNGFIFVAILAIIPTKQYRLMPVQLFVFYVFSWLITMISGFEMVFAGLGINNDFHIWIIYYSFLILSVPWFYFNYRSDSEVIPYFIACLMFLLSFFMIYLSVLISIQTSLLVFTIMTFVVEFNWCFFMIIKFKQLKTIYGNIDIEVPSDPKLILNNSNAPQDTTKLDEALEFINREGIEKCTFDQ